MKKSISIWSFPATLALTEKLLLARKAGFDGFEIAMLPSSLTVSEKVGEKASDPKRRKASG